MEINSKYAASELKEKLIHHVSELYDMFMPEPQFNINVSQDPSDNTKFNVDIKITTYGDGNN
jgi:DNA topoisomerase VI subunit A